LTQGTVGAIIASEFLLRSGVVASQRRDVRVFFAFATQITRVRSKLVEVKLAVSRACRNMMPILKSRIAQRDQPRVCQQPADAPVRIAGA
jgi:hypothetical protein